MLTLQGPNHPVAALTFSPDSTTLYAIQGHHGIHAWSIVDRTATRAECEGRLLVSQYVFHPGGRWAFSCTAHTRPPDYSDALAIDLATGAARPFDCCGPRDTVAFQPDGGIVAIGGLRYKRSPDGEEHDVCQLCWWQLTDAGPELVRQRELPPGEAPLLVAGLGDRFATADAFGSRDFYPDLGRTDRVMIRRAADGEREVALPFPRTPIDQLLASPNRTVLVARFCAELHVWDATDWNRPPIVLGNSANDSSLMADASFHPSGRFLLLANDTPSVRLFDTTTWQQVQSWQWGAGQLRSIAVSPDGTLAAAGSESGAVVVWDLDL